MTKDKKRLKELSVIAEKIIDLIFDTKNINSTECSLIVSGVVASILENAPNKEAKKVWMENFKKDCKESELKLRLDRPSLRK